MIELQSNLFVGNESDCRRGGEGWAVVHACKHPCHVRAVGYSGSLPSSHPHYLVFEDDDDLILNMIDPPVPLFKAELFEAFLAFARRKTLEGKKLLVHCNQGESRAPSLALVFLAKIAGVLPNDSYATASSAFREIFSGYRPGRGIQAYLSANWNTLGSSG